MKEQIPSKVSLNLNVTIASGLGFLKTNTKILKNTIKRVPKEKDNPTPKLTRPSQFTNISRNIIYTTNPIMAPISKGNGLIQEQKYLLETIYQN